MDKKYKPIFHITPKKGWINDPNGIVKFKGLYHVFYQYHPFSTEWGPMHWGHVVSEDLLHWRYLPIALTPGDEFDKDGCFSGTSLVKDGVLYIAYTGFINHEEPEKIKQIQCLASSEDGVHFKKHGVILTGDDLPIGYKSCDFRDPKLFFEDGYYKLLVAAKKINNKGDILLYRSLDLKKWEFVSSVLSCESEGEMIECVDYHKDLGLLLFSEQNFPKDNPHCLNIHSCEYEIGEFKDNKFVPNNKKTLLDYGFDFYAPQIMNDEHILLAWLNMWERSNPSAQYGFAGMLTVPRKVYVENDKLLQKPVIFGELVTKTQINNTYVDHISVGTIVLKVKDLKSLFIELRKGEDEVTKFYLQDEEFYFDRSRSGIEIKGGETDSYSLAGIRKMPFDRKEENTIYIVLDKYSVEIFVNGISMSNVIYPKESSDGLEINLDSTGAYIDVYK